MIDPYAPPVHSSVETPVFHFRTVFRKAGCIAYSGKVSVWSDRFELWAWTFGNTVTIPFEQIAKAHLVRHGPFQMAVEVAFVPRPDAAVTLVRLADFSGLFSQFDRQLVSEVADYLNQHAGLEDRDIPKWSRWPWAQRKLFA